MLLKQVLLPVGEPLSEPFQFGVNRQRRTHEFLQACNRRRHRPGMAIVGARDEYALLRIRTDGKVHIASGARERGDGKAIGQGFPIR